MTIDIVTKNDIEELRQLLFTDLTKLLEPVDNSVTNWIRSREVLNLLSCSKGTLKNLRNNNILSYSKLGGSLYYDRNEIERILKQNIYERNNNSE